MTGPIRQPLITTAMQTIRPVLGAGVGEGVRRFNLFRALLASHSLYAIWAEPIPNGTGIHWQTELTGEVRSYDSLSPDEQEKARRVLRYYVDAVYGLIVGHREADDLRPILDDCFEIPSLSCLYLVGRRPVLVLWGYLYSDVNPPRGIIRKLIRGIDPPHLMVNVKVVKAGSQLPVPQADVRLRYEGNTRRLVSNPDGNVSFQEILPFDYPVFQLDATADEHRPTAASLRLDRSVTDLIWSGFTPLITTLTLLPAVQETDFRVLVLDAQTEQPIVGVTLTLSTERLERVGTTSNEGDVWFMAMPVREEDVLIAYATHPRYPDERLEFRPNAPEQTLRLDPNGLRGKRGAFSVNLRWQTIDDLDLLVTDPGDNLVYYGNRRVNYRGSEGVLDIDANAADESATTEPQENAYWESPQPGEYRVEVLLYKRRSSTDSDIPFEITVFQNNDRLTLPGNIRTLKDRQFITIVDL